jgi:NDP-sugar pyrophosphorylase family protein
MSIKKKIPHIKNIKFFILAGGYGKRARPLSLVKPKPAFPLHGTPLINILLEEIKKSGFNKGFINLHHKPEAIRDCTDKNSGLTIKYLYEEKLSGNKILEQVAGDVDEWMFILNGDVFLEVTKIPVEKIIRELIEIRADGALLLRKNNDPAYKSVITEKGIFKDTEISEGGESLMYTGAALFRKKIIEKIADISFFDTLIKHPFKVKIYTYDGLWLDIGTPRLYFDTNLQYKNYMKKDSTLNSLSGNVTISTESTVENSIIWENTDISGNSSLLNCIITGNLALHNANFSNKIIYSIEKKMKVEEF